MQNNNNGLYFYKLISPYNEDETRNCKLTISEIDSNFLNLKNEDIQSAELDIEKWEILINKKDGQAIHLDISDLESKIQEVSSGTAVTQLNEIKGEGYSEDSQYNTLKSINDELSKLNGNKYVTNSIQNQIKNNNETLIFEDIAEPNTFVTEVSEYDGIITTKRAKVTSSNGDVVISSTPDGGIDLSIAASATTAYGSDAIFIENLDDGSHVSLKIANGEKVLTQDANGLRTNLGIKFDSDTKEIQLLNGTSPSSDIVAKFDASAFLTDGMIENVTLSGTSSSPLLVFTYNNDSNKEPIVIDMEQFVNVYKPSNAINISNDKTISLILDNSGDDEFLTITNDGLKIQGISNAISASTQLEASIREDNDNDLNDKISNSNSRIKTLEDKVNTIVFNAKANISVSPSYIYLHNEKDAKDNNVNISISVNASFTSNGGLIADTIEIINASNNEVLAISSGNTISYSEKITLVSNSGQASKAYKVIANYKGTEFTTTGYVNGRYPILYGFSSELNKNTGFTDAQISYLAKLPVTNTATRTYLSTATLNIPNQHMYICIPIGMGELNTFTMGGIIAGFSKIEGQMINNISYLIYETVETYNKGAELIIEAK